MEAMEKQKQKPAAENMRRARQPSFSTVHRGMNDAAR
jgi:hypothetical protein